MINVAIITAEQAETLRAVAYAVDSHCNPVQDGLGRWVISVEEMNGLGLDLEVIEWTPPATEGLEHPTPTALHNEEFGGYFRRSTSMNSDGLYTIESNPNPVLKDGTILTAENHEQYDGAEGWQWYAAGDPV